MLPRLHVGGGVGSFARVPTGAALASRGSRVQAARHICTSSKRQASASRLPAVAPSARLVLRPTGTGSSEHIGQDKVPAPATIPLEEGIFEVGRGSPADIRINVPTVSSRHALLRVEANRVRVTDLNSTNGTRVNGEELSPLLENIELEVGSEIIFGDHHLARFRLDELDDATLAAALSRDTAGAGAPEASDAGSTQLAARANNATMADI